MPSELSDELNLLAREWVRQVRPKFRNQTELGQALGLDQSSVSALLSAKSSRGTTVQAFIRAGRLVGLTDAELAQRLGLRTTTANAAPFSPMFLAACPAPLRRLIEDERLRPSAIIAQQLLRIYEVDNRPRTPMAWRSLASLLDATNDPPGDRHDDGGDPPHESTARPLQPGDGRRSSRKLKAAVPR